jgi:hypothetical protein
LFIKNTDKYLPNSYFLANHMYTKSFMCNFSLSYFNPTKQFSHKLSFFCYNFVVWVRCCVVSKLSSCNIIWFYVLVLLIGSYWNTGFNQLKVQLKIWALTLWIMNIILRSLNFIILLVGILPLYTINLDVVNLFANLFILFLTMLNLYLYSIYSINLYK